MGNEETDLTVIGAGPVGLFTVFEAGMMKLSCHVIDSLNYVGGQCMALYPEKPIFDIPGFPVVQAGQLVEKLYEQAAPFNPTYHLGQQATSIKQERSGCWITTTSSGLRIKARAILIAAGSGSFSPNRLPIEGVETFEERSIFYKITNIEMFRDKRVAIAGGGDSAVDWAITLAPITRKVYLIHRRKKFRASPQSLARLTDLASQDEKQRSIELVIPYQLDNLCGENGQISCIFVRDSGGKQRSIDVEALLLFFGLSSNLGPITEWSLNLKQEKIVVDPGTMETSKRGVFAVGDIATYPRKLKLILTGFFEAAMAVYRIRELAYPEKPIRFQYSTTQGIPGVNRSL